MRTDSSNKLTGLFGGALGNPRKCLGDLTEVDLQKELLRIVHHLNDAQAGMDNDDADYAKASLRDIHGVVDRLKNYLPSEMAEGIEGTEA